MAKQAQLRLLENTIYVIQNKSVLRMAEHYSVEFGPILSKVRQKWSSVIMEYLRDETGLRLRESKLKSSPKGNTKDKNLKYTVVLDRNEIFLKTLDKNYPDLDFDEFLANRNLKSAMDRALDYYPENGKAINYQFKSVHKYLKYYLDKYKVEEILEQLYTNKDRSLDIWGTYNLNNSHIELYIIPLVLFTKLFPIDLEYALLTTLVHEMAHAFHHIGKDSEGLEWESMGNSDDNIVEGLAEYYTWQFVEDHKDQHPEMKKTYDYMYKCLGGPYIIFQEWIHNGYSRDHVRIALQATRRYGIIKYEEFLEKLKRTKDLIK
ncbi:MAG: hypothetical protein JNJ58_09365 [Chitinophagaceae bacterium]|nr:hypothetical protein [Chitinophagaceae bacterium]